MQDEKFMRRAFQLARLGAGRTSPNPMVGCVIVHEGKIIGEGWHQMYGGPHAEVNAIRSVSDRTLLPSSTAYVSLEPCAHFGKTPPCADLLVENKIRRVVISNRDPFPAVNGSGIKKLKSAGIAVEVGVLEQEGHAINRRFFSFHQKKRPYVVLKWAQTSDGFIARKNFDSKWISSELSRKLVHKWRSEEDAILVGTNTAKYDNPSLNVRSWSGSNPLRIVIDKRLKLDKSLHLFDTSIPTLCYNLEKSTEESNLSLVKVNEDSFLKDMMDDLYQRNVQSVFVEGGSHLLNSLISDGIWDEARIFISRTEFTDGIKAPHLSLNGSPVVVSTDQLYVRTNFDV